MEGLSRALVVGAVADRVVVAGIVEFAKVVDIVGVDDIVEAVVGWDRGLAGLLEIARRCRALVVFLWAADIADIVVAVASQLAGAAPFDFVFVVELDFVFVALFFVAFAGIARGFHRPAGFSSFPQVVR